MSVLSSPASPSSCRKKHIVCKLNMSFGLFHYCELTSCGFSASLFFFFFWPDHTAFFSPIFHYYLFKFFSLVALRRTRRNFGWFRTRIEGEKRIHPRFADCSTPVMCRHIYWTLYYVDAHWVTGLSSNLINSHTTL